MTRGLASAAFAATQAEVVRWTMAVELDFVSGFARYCGAPFDLVIEGNVFTGLGDLGQISVIEESAELQSYGLTVGLTGVPGDNIAIALTENYRKRPARVWLVPLDADDQPEADPVLVFRGYMDQMNGSLGETGAVSVSLQNSMVRWEETAERRYTDEEQRAAWPGDRFLEFVSATTEKSLDWPARTFRA